MIVTSCIYSPNGAHNSFAAGTENPPSTYDYYNEANEVLRQWVDGQAELDEEIFFSNDIPSISHAAQSARLVVLGPACCSWRFITTDEIDATVLHYLPEGLERHEIQTYQGAIICRTIQELNLAVIHVIDELPA